MPPMATTAASITPPPLTAEAAVSPSPLQSQDLKPITSQPSNTPAPSLHLETLPPPEVPSPPLFLNSIAELKDLSAAISAFQQCYDDLHNHLDSIKAAILAKMPSETPQITQPTAPSPPKPDVADERISPKQGEEQNPPESELVGLCKTMCSRGVRKFLAAHLSDLPMLREDVPKALRQAPNPPKLVLECLGKFFLQGSKTFTENSPMIPAREASILILECFLLMMGMDITNEKDGGVLSIEKVVKEEADTSALAWRKRLVAEGGVAKANQIDARGLLLFVACFGVPALFKVEDIRDLVIAANAKEFLDVLNKSHLLMSKISEVRAANPEQITQVFKDRVELLGALPEAERDYQVLLTEEALFEVGLSSIPPTDALPPPVPIHYPRIPPAMADQRGLVVRIAERRSKALADRKAEKGKGKAGPSGPPAAGVEPAKKKRRAVQTAETAVSKKTPLARPRRSLIDEADPATTVLGLLGTPTHGQAGVGGLLPLTPSHWLDFHSDRAATAEKMIGVRPNFLIDYARINSPKVDPRMPPEIRDAMEASARGWSPDLERLCKEMPPPERLQSAAALIGAGLGFIMNSYGGFIEQDRQLALEKESASSLRGAMDTLRAESASVKEALAVTERSASQYRAKLETARKALLEERTARAVEVEALRRQAAEEAAKAAEDARASAIDAFKNSEDYEAELNETHSFAYEDVIGEILAARPDVDVEFLRAALLKFRKDKGLADEEEGEGEADKAGTGSGDGGATVEQGDQPDQTAHSS